MSELSFLLHLLLDHKLPIKTKALIKTRIGEIESRHDVRAQPTTRNLPPHLANQAPSMQAKIQAMEEEKLNHPPPQALLAPTQATTPAAALALQDRQKLINQAINGKEEQGRTSPRKF